MPGISISTNIVVSKMNSHEVFLLKKNSKFVKQFLGSLIFAVSSIALPKLKSVWF